MCFQKTTLGILNRELKDKCPTNGLNALGEEDICCIMGYTPYRICKCFMRC